jgi:phosphotransferase system IIB component
MKRLTVITLLVIAAGLFGCSNQPSSESDSGWFTLLDGNSLDNWNRIGDANWRIADGVVMADWGNGYLVSKNTYANFQIRAEFWADDNVNSGIFIRAEDPKKIGATNAYEVNIFDKRPDPTYGTGAIVDVAKVVPMPKAGGKWNVYEITAQGNRLIVVLNGVQTVDVQDSKHSSGVIALQHGADAVNNTGVVKFRKVQIRPL